MASVNTGNPSQLQRTSQALLKLLSTAVDNRLIIPRAFMRSGKYAEAIDQTEIILDEVAASFGLQHPATSKICLELAQMYRLAGRPEEAAEWVKMAADNLRAALKAS
jgi:hypothetical protein